MNSGPQGTRYSIRRQNLLNATKIQLLYPLLIFQDFCLQNDSIIIILALSTLSPILVFPYKWLLFVHLSPLIILYSSHNFLSLFLFLSLSFSLSLSHSLIYFSRLAVTSILLFCLFCNVRFVSLFTIAFSCY